MKKIKCLKYLNNLIRIFLVNLINIKKIRIL